MAKMGRPSIFEMDGNGTRVQGVLTVVGGVCFEARRVALRGLYTRIMGHAPPSVSDAATIEFMARGVAATTKYLKGRRRARGR